MIQAGNIKGAYTVVQRNTEIPKLPAGYYRVELIQFTQEIITFASLFHIIWTTFIVLSSRWRD